jgi:hypothetical protein
MDPLLSDRNISYIWDVWSRQCGGAGGWPDPPPTTFILSLTWVFTELSELEISHPTHSFGANSERCKCKQQSIR